MPAPMMAPIPSVTRLSGVSARFSWCSPASLASARRVAMDLVAHKLMRDSVREGDESTARDAPRFAGGGDLSIEEGCERSVRNPKPQRPLLQRGHQWLYGNLRLSKRRLRRVR